MSSKKESIREYVIFLIVYGLLSAILGAFFGNRLEDTRKDTSVVQLDVERQDGEQEYYFTFTIPDGDLDDKCIAFPTRHFGAKVLIDDKLVYSIETDNYKFNHSTGYHWNFIRLKDADHGKTMKIIMIPAYEKWYPTDEIYMGSQLNIMSMIIRDNGVRFLLSVLIFIVGCVVLVYFSFIMDKKQRDDTLLHLAVFSLSLAVWSMMESPICELVSPGSAYNLVIDHYALMVMPASFMLFMCRIFNIKKTKIYLGYLHFNFLIIAIRTILQVTTIKDLKETLWLTQLSIVVLAVIAAAWIIRALRKGHLTKSMKTNLFWVAMLIAATVIELFLFIVFNKNNLIGMIGFAGYIVVMSVENIRKSRKQLRHAHEVELYRKLAFTDELTGAYNRTAFGRDMEDCMMVNEKTGKQMIRPTTLFMFDLNDLKKCNDNFGHEYGDQYIKMIAEVILRSIGVDGKCYRIGGDEFCAIMHTNVKNEVDSKLISIIQEVEELDRNGFVVPVSVAVGYATYNPEYDESLEDTMKRADTLMYQNKQLIKKNRLKNNENK